MSLEQVTSRSPRDRHHSWAACPPGRLRGTHQLPASTQGAEEASKVPGHASAEGVQPLPAHCVGPAQLVLGSPGWGELVLPPQSWIGCTGRVSQHHPSPPLPISTHPSQHRLGYGASTHGGPQPCSLCSPGALRCGLQGGTPAPGSRASVSDAAVGSDAAAGLGELVTAARRE